MTISNLPLPDQLADVREQLWRLKAKEEEIKASILANPDLCEGAHYLAEIKETTQERVDIKELRANHPSIVAEYTFPLKFTSIEISGITEDGEIVAIRRRGKDLT